jgi:hypothetical protein
MNHGGCDDVVSILRSASIAARGVACPVAAIYEHRRHSVAPEGSIEANVAYRQGDADAFANRGSPRHIAAHADLMAIPATERRCPRAFLRRHLERQRHSARHAQVHEDRARPDVVCLQELSVERSDS